MLYSCTKTVDIPSKASLNEEIFEEKIPEQHGYYPYMFIDNIAIYDFEQQKTESQPITQKNHIL